MELQFVEDNMTHGPNSSVNGSHTLAEILSQPEVWQECWRGLATDGAFQAASKFARERGNWLFTGCGTSFYLAEAAAACWTLLTGQTARAVPSSELLLFPQLSPLNDSKLQTVVISRSGCTSEAIRAAEALRKVHKRATLGITCAPDSQLAKICELTIALPAADEKSMVMTRSFSSMLLTLIRLAAESVPNSGQTISVERVAAALSGRIQSWNAQVERFVGERVFEDYIYLAQGPRYPIAREAALKVTEMSHSYAQAYHTLEFRHGPKSIVAPQTCIVFLLGESAMQAESEVLLEMKELGGTIVTICNQASKEIRKASDLVLELECAASEVELLAPLVVPAQLLGYHTGVKKGFNPDEPKNLTRVVILD